MSERPPPAIRTPCSAALGAFGVPARRWTTRTDLYKQLDIAREYLDEADVSEVTVLKAAEAAGLSLFHFVRLFRQTYGENPADRVAKRRLKCARARLSEGKDAIGVIAQEMGFQSASGFSRFFSRLTGLSPTEFRKLSNCGQTCRADDVAD